MAQIQPPPPPGQPKKRDTGSPILWVAIAVLLVVDAGIFFLYDSPAAGGNPAPRSQVTVSGEGIMSSEPVTLAGDYRVDWLASNDGGRDCFHGTTLRTTGGERAADLILTEVHGSGSGTVYVYGLESGRYYVDASSGCAWSFTFVPD